MSARPLFSWLLIVVVSVSAAYLAQAGEGAKPLPGVYRVLGSNEDGSRYAGMAAVTENAGKYTFRWWIGTQTYSGTGQFENGLISVNWGNDKPPVIYTLGVAGNLRGKWAEGKASEVLKLHAYAANPTVSIQEGTYAASGRSVNGSRYKGVVTIARKGDGYALELRIGDERYSGEGTIESNILTVNWGHTTPVIYAPTEEGNLRGLWDAGTGEEALIPE